MASKYVDTTSIIQIIGCVYNNLRLLDITDRYTITDEDFPDEFHKIFGFETWKFILLFNFSPGDQLLPFGGGEIIPEFSFLRPGKIIAPFVFL